MKINNRDATVGCLSDITERAYISSFIFNKFTKIYTHKKYSTHNNKRVIPSTGINILPDLTLMWFTRVFVTETDTDKDRMDTVVHQDIIT